MKRKLIVIIVSIICLVVLIGFSIVKSFENNLQALQQISIPAIDISKIPSGEYFGSYVANPINVEVMVTVDNKTITEIKIIKHINGQGAPAEAILEQVIASQSLEVDLITGATYSSKVILLAIGNALLGDSNTSTAD